MIIVCDFRCLHPGGFFKTVAQSLCLCHITFSRPCAFTNNWILHPLHILSVFTVITFDHLFSCRHTSPYQWVNVSWFCPCQDCKIRESGVKHKIRNVSWHVSAPWMPLFSRSNIRWQLHNSHLLYLYRPPVMAFALPSGMRQKPCKLSTRDRQLLTSWLTFKATPTLWLSSRVVMANRSV